MSNLPLSAAAPVPAIALPPGAKKIGMGRLLPEVRSAKTATYPLIVEFRHVTKTYNVGESNEFTAIRDVSFAVEDLPEVGELICVLGPSGCGKSTILRLIAGLAPQHPATSGEVLVLGKPVVRPGSDRGMVFQDYTSFDHRTVLENVTFGLECLGMRRQDRNDLGREWIRKVGLSIDKDQDKYPHELSGGMCQRVAIARTLILRPKIILMDEPFGALDPQTRFNMQDLLLELWKEIEATVFFITHSIEESVYLGDRVYLMTSSPGQIMRELAVVRPNLPARQIQRDPEFQETVNFIRDLISELEGAM
ncbi:MAG TPA: ABC transporter ATP-binding protein [Pirellulales bacterium]|jgi:NitT/TauT family transport system ATP-binding protein|nr:ABC transporter ATP-binding protein [Pirellulales bacterium]